MRVLKVTCKMKMIIDSKAFILKIKSNKDIVVDIVVLVFLEISSDNFLSAINVT